MLVTPSGRFSCTCASNLRVFSPTTQQQTSVAKLLRADVIHLCYLVQLKKSFARQVNASLIPTWRKDKCADTLKRLMTAIHSHSYIIQLLPGLDYVAPDSGVKESLVGTGTQVEAV